MDTNKNENWCVSVLESLQPAPEALLRKCSRGFKCNDPSYFFKREYIMNKLKMSLAVMMGMALLFGVFATQALAQNTAGQAKDQQLQMGQPQQQQHMKDMNDMMERMNLLINRLHTMHQMVEQQLQTDKQPENAAYLRHIQALEQSMGNVGENMKATIQNYNTLNENKMMLKDAQFTRDMRDLKDQMQSLGMELSKAVGTLEGMNKRIIAQKTK
jgi:hypothetical protein